MGMYDTVLVLDDVPALSCPHGHALREFQTKDLEAPSMQTYLLRRGCLCRARFQGGDDEEMARGWRIEGEQAVFERRYLLEMMAAVRSVRVYTHCARCEPILVRRDAVTFHDIVGEHSLFVDFTLTLRPGEPPQVERTTGTRADLEKDMSARGHWVLRDDEPLAIAHRQVRQARAAAGKRSSSWWDW